MTITVGPNLGLLINGNKGEEHYNQLMHQWRALDGLVQPVAISMGETIPPGVNSNGDVHIVGEGATGSWAGMDNRIARYFTLGVGAPAWEFYVPKAGWQMRVLSQLDTNGLPRTAEYSGTAWGLVESGAASDVPVEEIAASNYDVDSSRNGAYLRMTATGGTTLTIRTQDIHPLPDNGVWHIRNAGDDDMTVVPEGVVLNIPAGGSYTVPAGGVISIKRIAVNAFDLFGVTTGSGGSAVAATDFEANVAYLTFTDNDDKVRLNLDEAALSTALGVDDKLDASAVGAANGVAPLNSSGQVPSANLPSYVDDVLEFATFSAFPATGETGKVYISLAAGTDGGGAFPANQQFRWGGSAYQRIVASPGTTDNVPEGSTNKYFTDARTRATPLTGFVAAASMQAIVAADTVLGAFNKIQKWLSSLGTAAFATLTTSATDTAIGRVLKTGDAGWLGLNSTSITDADSLLVAANYQLPSGSAGTFSNFPSWADPSRSTLLAMGNFAPYGTQVYWERASARSAYRIYNGAFLSWIENWTTGNTSADIQTFLAAADYAAARTVLGAGTSNLQIGTTGTTAKAGNYQPTAEDISNAGATGRVILKAADVSSAQFALGVAPRVTTVNVASTSQSLSNGTEGKIIRLTAGSAKTITVPTSATSPDGQWHIRNVGAGNATLTPSGTTLNAPYGGTLVVPPGGTVTLQKVGSTDEFDVIGQTVAA